MSCPVCGQAHTTVFCPPKKNERPAATADRRTCSHPLPWETIGRCAYCVACRSRMMQGTAPTTEEGRTAVLDLFAAIENRIAAEGTP